MKVSINLSRDELDALLREVSKLADDLRSAIILTPQLAGLWMLPEDFTFTCTVPQARALLAVVEDSATSKKITDALKISELATSAKETLTAV